MSEINKITLLLLFCFWLPFNMEAKSSAQELTRISDVGVDLYGTILFSGGWPQGVNKYDSAGIYSFRYENNYQHRPILAPWALPSGGAVYANGKVYVNTFDNESNLGKRKPVWKILNATTWALEKEIELADNFYGITTSLAYDPVSKKIYAYALKNYMEAEFAVIEPETALIRRIAPISQKLYGMACNKDGVLYGLTASYELVTINKATGALTPVCAVLSHGLNNYNYSQAITFNQATGKLYWINLQNDNDGEERTFLQEINLTNGTTTLITTLPKGMFISGAFFIEPHQNAPKAAPELTYISKEAGSEQGTFEFITPSTTYFGEPLSEKITARLYEDGKVIETIENLEPNTKYTSSEHTFSTGIHSVDIEMENTSGKGSKRTIKFYSGWDVPKSPSNAKLVRDGLKSIVTWDAPVAGQNGGLINPDFVRYKVQLYPGEITVAEGLKERQYTHQHGEEMTRYIYRITSYTNDREGGNILSNNLIIGTPLDPPYDGYFPDIFSMMNYFTILDLNKDWATWYYDDNSHSAYYWFNMFAPANDWLISPALNMKAGHTYKLSFKAWSSLPPYLESLKVTFGNSIKPEDQSTVLLDFPQLPGDHTKYTADIYVEKDGIYHFGFYAYSTKFREFLFVQDINLDGGQILNKTGVIEDENIKVTTQKSRVVIQNPNGTLIDIVNLQGVVCLQSYDTEIIKELPSGIYIVKYNRFSKKISIP